MGSVCIPTAISLGMSHSVVLLQNAEYVKPLLQIISEEEDEDEEEDEEPQLDYLESEKVPDLPPPLVIDNIPILPPQINSKRPTLLAEDDDGNSFFTTGNNIVSPRLSVVRSIKELLLQKEQNNSLPVFDLKDNFEQDRFDFS
jgi:hypothetical protein